MFYINNIHMNKFFVYMHPHHDALSSGDACTGAAHGTSIVAILYLREELKLDRGISNWLTPLA
jgi:hypothetical protein